MGRATYQVVVMQGVSGSGKSTMASRIAADAGDGAVIVSADDFFMVGGKYKFDPSRLSYAHAMCFKKFLDALAAGARVVVVDNTNTSAAEISPYMLAAAAYGYDARILSIECRPDVAALRGLHGVPAGAIRAQAARINDFLLSGNTLRWPVERVPAASEFVAQA